MTFFSTKKTTMTNVLQFSSMSKVMIGQITNKVM